MTKFYAAQHVDGGAIEEDASICVFATRTEAEAHAKSPLTPDPGEKIAIDTGTFSDCWIKGPGSASDAEIAALIAPLSLEDVSVLRPGQHPGGNNVWISPQVDILVAVIE